MGSVAICGLSCYKGNESYMDVFRGIRKRGSCISQRTGAKEYVYILGPDHRQWKDVVKGKYLLLKVIETGHDEYNSWEEYIILRGK